MFVNKNLKKYRELQNLTQKELAELSGVSISTISKLESGVLNNPSIGIIACMAIVLHVNCSDLEIDDRPEPSPFTLIDESCLIHLEEKGFLQETWSPYNSMSLFDKADWLLDIILGKAFELNDEARYKIIEYENDLIYCGKYNRKDANKDK